MARRFLITPDTTPQAAADGTGADDAPPASPVRWRLHGVNLEVAIAGNVVVAVLFFVAIIWRVFFTGTTTGQEGAAAVSPQAQEASAHGGAAERALFSSAGSTPTCASPRSGGLGMADLQALPVYVHGSSAEAEAAVGGAEGTTVECAVCLGELRDGETCRVLPRCGHRFHAECVDRWFRSHVTCPLCRAVVADGGSGKSPKVQLGV